MLVVLIAQAALAESPDLVFHSITADSQPDGEQVALQVVIENIGNARAGETSLDVLSSADWDQCDTLAWESTLNNGLAPGEKTSLTITLPREQLIGSPAYLFLDIGGRISEGDEHNNEGVVYLMSDVAVQPERASDWTWWQHSPCLQDQARERTSADIGLSRKVLYSRLRLR